MVCAVMAIDIHSSSAKAESRIAAQNYLNVPEAASYIGISQRTLRSLIADRKIRVIRLGGRVILRRIDIDRFLDQHAEGGVAV